ncbi:MAG: DUF4405 domain-containing protein [Paracoccaceae bacterium]|nr:DUF4405 domain-containing protein [Paracoccaceae bacterium]MDE3240775.1 DUF4405 domain-containing protein [Paracoccaceae bacterium]
MPQLLSRYATPFVTGLFLISLVTGVALYFHVGPSAFHSMHEVLSMVLIVPFVLHLWKNIRPFSNYFKRLPMQLALVASLALAGLFFLPAASTGSAGGPPQFALARQMLSASPASVAPVLHTTPDALVARLKAAGFAQADASTSLNEIARGAGKTSEAIARILIQAKG